MDALDIDTLHLRSHASKICQDYQVFSYANSLVKSVDDYWTNLYEYSLDILCLMALTEALGLEYGGFVN